MTPKAPRTPLAQLIVRQGIIARQKGRPISDNPYTNSPHWCTTWNDGWRQADTQAKARAKEQ